jgi:replication factor C small subunit
VEYSEGVINKLVEMHYPDIRKMIQLCQQYSAINGNIDNEIFNYERIDAEFYDYLLDKDFKNARKYVLDKNYAYDEMFTNLYREYVPLLSKDLQPQAIILIAEYMYKNAFAIDKEINFAACILELMQI